MALSSTTSVFHSVLEVPPAVCSKGHMHAWKFWGAVPLVAGEFKGSRFYYSPTTTDQRAVQKQINARTKAKFVGVDVGMSSCPSQVWHGDKNINKPRTPTSRPVFEREFYMHCETSVMLTCQIAIFLTGPRTTPYVAPLYFVLLF